MNFKIILYISHIFVAFCDEILEPVRENQKLVPIVKAFNEVVEEFFIKSQIPFNFIGDSQDFTDLNGFYRELLAQNDEKISYWMRSWRRLHTNLTDSAVILIKDLIDYEQIHIHFNLINKFPKPIKILTYIDYCQTEMIQMDIQYLIET